MFTLILNWAIGQTLKRSEKMKTMGITLAPTFPEEIIVNLIFFRTFPDWNNGNFRELYTLFRRNTNFYVGLRKKILNRNLMFENDCKIFVNNLFKNSGSLRFPKGLATMIDTKFDLKIKLVW